jgi:hypothetical protein
MSRHVLDGHQRLSAVLSNPEPRANEEVSLADSRDMRGVSVLAFKIHILQSQSSGHEEHRFTGLE